MTLEYPVMVHSARSVNLSEEFSGQLGNAHLLGVKELGV